MLDVPERTNAVGSSKAPTASIAATASLHPTATGVPSGRPNASAASAVTAPRSSHGAASGGHTLGPNPTRSSTAPAASKLRTWQTPLLDHGSDSGDPVNRRPTKSFGCKTNRVL